MMVTLLVFKNPFYPHIPDQDVPQLLARLHLALVVANVFTLGLNGKQCVEYPGSHIFVEEL